MTQFFLLFVVQKNDYDEGKRSEGFLSGLGVNNIGERYAESQKQNEEK